MLAGELCGYFRRAGGYVASVAVRYRVIYRRPAAGKRYIRSGHIKAGRGGFTVVPAIEGVAFERRHVGNGNRSAVLNVSLSVGQECGRTGGRSTGIAVRYIVMIYREHSVRAQVIGGHIKWLAAQRSAVFRVLRPGPAGKGVTRLRGRRIVVIQRGVASIGKRVSDIIRLILYAVHIVGDRVLVGRKLAVCIYVAGGHCVGLSDYRIIGIRPGSPAAEGIAFLFGRSQRGHSVAVVQRLRLVIMRTVYIIGNGVVNLRPGNGEGHVVIRHVEAAGIKIRAARHPAGVAVAVHCAGSVRNGHRCAVRNAGRTGRHGHAIGDIACVNVGNAMCVGHVGNGLGNGARGHIARYRSDVRGIACHSWAIHAVRITVVVHAGMRCSGGRAIRKHIFDRQQVAALGICYGNLNTLSGHGAGNGRRGSGVARYLGAVNTVSCAESVCAYVRCCRGRIVRVHIVYRKRVAVDGERAADRKVFSGHGRGDSRRAPAAEGIARLFGRCLHGGGRFVFVGILRVLLAVHRIGHGVAVAGVVQAHHVARGVAGECYALFAYRGCVGKAGVELVYRGNGNAYCAAADGSLGQLVAAAQLLLIMIDRILNFRVRRIVEVDNVGSFIQTHHEALLVGVRMITRYVQEGFGNHIILGGLNYASIKRGNAVVCLIVVDGIGAAAERGVVEYHRVVFGGQRYAR